MASNQERADQPALPSGRISWSIKEYSDVSSLSIPTIYRLAAEGKLRIVKVGRRSIVPVSSGMALIEGRAA